MWNISVENIGGIRSGTTTVDEGLNVIQASNFRGKSSLVAALRTGIGATGQFEEHPLTEGADAGRVAIETDDEVYEVGLERTGTGVTRRGTPYLADGTDQLCARLFAALDENNPIRRAVRDGEDLTELLQAPLDIEEIDRQIETLQREQSEIEAEIAAAERAGEQLPAVQEDVTSLERKLEELSAERDELAAAESNREQIAGLSDEISAKSGELATTVGDVERLEEEIERRERRVQEKQEELEALEEPGEVDESVDVEAKREELDRLETQRQLVEDLYRANQNVLEAGELDLVADVERTIAADEIACWVCGNRSTGDEIREHVERLQSRATELREQKRTLQAELDAHEQRRQEVRERRQKREQLQRDVERMNAEIEDRQGTLQRKRERKEALEGEITELKSELEDAETEYNEELTDVKTEIRTTETELETRREQLEELEREYETLAELEAERDELRARLAELRDRKKNTQEELKAQFNAIIADIVDRFEPGFSGARLVLKTDERGEVEEIDLEIAREIDGKGRRTSVEALSEGEVELIGLVVVLAGYHAFDVGENVPVILIDGISQLAAEHLRSVATYLEDTSEILVTTAYPEAGEFRGQTIDPDGWEVVSDEVDATG